MPWHSIEGAAAAFGDDEVESHRVVMKREVHTKTVLKADGNEETTIKEDSEIHQDSEPPEHLRDSMQQIINQFMDTDPQVPLMPATEDDKKPIDEGTEV